MSMSRMMRVAPSVAPRLLPGRLRPSAGHAEFFGGANSRRGFLSLSASRLDKAKVATDVIDSQPAGARKTAFQCPKSAPVSVSPGDKEYQQKPYVDFPFLFVGGQKVKWDGEITEVTSPIVDSATGKRAVIGRVAAFTEAEAVKAVEAAANAWDQGQGAWPQKSMAARIAAVKHFLQLLKGSRESIITTLMWEICKNTADATAEFDRTMTFCEQAIDVLQKSDDREQFGTWTTVSGVCGRVRRGPVGVTLMLAPFNYPLNEMYAMMIPALLMGNTIVLKLPAVGGLAHILTADSLAAALPPGVVNFVTGSGRKTMGPILKSGSVDCLGFIGGAKTMDALITQHPQPHRLKVFSQLEAKNIAIVLKDADLDLATTQITLGALSYNGQRCTACKLIMCDESVVESFKVKLIAAIKDLKVGLPWENGVKITPLPEPAKPAYLEELLVDALGKGSQLVNAGAGGGNQAGALCTPAVLFPVTPSMKVFTEEQFGPVVPIASFKNVSEVHKAARDSWNGQQAAVFTRNPQEAAPLVDMLSSIVGRINLNSQCSRGPDAFPFSGRRSSAMGTMSVSETLRAFSVEVIVAFPQNDVNTALSRGIEEKCSFFQPLVKKGGSEHPDALVGA